MVKQLSFILGRGAAVSAVPRAPTSQSVTTAPTSSARRSAAQPKTKARRPKR
jgi:hypothetical protein